MNNFGLGLILNFTDNATAGLQGATGAFNDLNSSITALADSNSAEEALMRLSATANIVGNSFYSVGQGITSMFTGVTQNIIDTGGTVKSALTQLSTLYGEAGVANYEAGQAILDKVKDYAAHSIFNFKDLVPSVIMLKANGIEAFDEIASSTGRARQTLMDYASDLAAFNPQMRNMYGTGVQAAIGALNEYIAEGSTVSIKRGASLDILAILGEEKGTTIEERSRQVADLIEQLGMVGITANLAGSPMQRLSNVGDVFFNLMTEISNSGVFEKYSSLVKRLTDYIFAIDENELKNLAQVISNALTSIMGLLDYVLDVGFKVVDWIRSLVKENPEIAEMVIKGTALAGVFMLIAGAGLKLISSLGMLRLSASMLFSTGISSGLKLAGVFKTIALKVAPLLILSKLIRVAWEKNLGGIQEKVKSVVTKVMDTFGLIFDAFTDNTLSMDNFEKAKKMGLLPLIEAILQLKYHFGFFIEGVKKGISNFIGILKSVFTKIMEFIPKISSLGGGITAFLEKITALGLTDNWEQAGYIISQIVAWVALLVTFVPPLIKAIKAVIKILQVAWTIIKIIINAVKVVIGLIKMIGYGLQALGFLASAPVGVVIAIVAGIVALIALVYKFRDEIAAFLVELWWKVEDFFIAIGDWIKNAVGAVKDFFSGIGEGISNAVSATKNFFSKVGEVIKGIWEEVQNNPVYKFFYGIFHAIYGFIYMIGSAIVVAVAGLGAGIANLGKMLGKGIVNALNAIKNFIVNAGSYIKDLFISIVDGAKAIVKAIGNFFVSLYNDHIAPIINAVTNAFHTAVEWTQDNIIEPAAKAIDKFFKGIGNAVEAVKEVFKTAFEGIKNVIVDAVQAAYNTVKPLLDWIANAVGNVVDGIGSVLESVGGFFEGAGDFFIGVGDTAREMVGLATGGYVKTTGIAVLHPNEVVVNDTLTKGLGNFLNDYQNRKATPKEQSQSHITNTNDTNTALLSRIGSTIENGIYSLINAIGEIKIPQKISVDNNEEQVNRLYTALLNERKNSADSVISVIKSMVDSNAPKVLSENGYSSTLQQIETDVKGLSTSMSRTNSILTKQGDSVSLLDSFAGSLLENFTDTLAVKDNNYSQLQNGLKNNLTSGFDAFTNSINSVGNAVVGNTMGQSSINQIGSEVIKGIAILTSEVIKGSKSPLVSQDIVATDDYSEMPDNKPVTPAPPPPPPNGTTSPSEEITNYTTENKTINQAVSGDTHIDNSVNFEAGSIVFNIDKETDLSNLTDENLRVMADKIFAIISRKLQIRSMQTRK